MKSWGVTCDELVSNPGGVAILLVLHATETGISCGSNGPLGLEDFICKHVLKPYDMSMLNDECHVQFFKTGKQHKQQQPYVMVISKNCTM